MKPFGIVTSRVTELEKAHLLRVEDGNHGEYRPRTEEFVPDGVAFIRAADISDGRVMFATAERINETARLRIRKGIGHAFDVLLSHKGTVGKVAFASSDSPPFVCSPQTTFWRSLDHDVIDPRFLFYYLLSASFQNQLRSLKGETDMADYVSLSTQRQLVLDIPQIAVQRSISKVLGVLDDKIEANRRLTTQLDVLGGEIFRALCSNGKDRLLHEVCEIVMGQSPPGISYNDTGLGLPLFQGSTDFGSRFPTPRVYCTAGIRFAEPSDVLLSVRAPVGDLNVADRDCVIGRGVAAIRRRGAPSFAYHLIRSIRPRLATYEDTGTVFSAINKAALAALPVTVPSESAIVSFETIVGPMDKLAGSLSREIGCLAELRDLVLPRLISAAYRVGQSEGTVEPVA